MTYAAKSILWIIGGSVASVVIGYAAFMFFLFVAGAGIDIDDIGSPTEKFFGGLALPALGIIALGGSLTSIVTGIRYAIAHRALMADSYTQTKRGEQGGDRDAEEAV